VHAAFNLRVELSDGNALGEFSYLPVAYFNKREPSCDEDPVNRLLGGADVLGKYFNPA